MTNAAMDEFDELFFNDDNNDCQNVGSGSNERRCWEDENPSSSNKSRVNNDDEGRTAIVGILPSSMGGGGEDTTTSDRRNHRSTVGMNTTNTNTKKKKHSDSSSKNDDVISIGSSSSSSSSSSLDQSVSSSSSSTPSSSDGSSSSSSSSSDGNYASAKNIKVGDSKFSTTTAMTASATRRGGETNNDTSPTTKSSSSSKSSSMNDMTTMKKKKKYECGDNIAMLDANVDDFLEEDEDDEDDDLLTSFFSTTTSPTATSVKKTDGGKTSLAYGSKKTTTNMSHVANSTNDETWGDIDNEKDGQCYRIRGGEQQLPSSSSSSLTTALRNDHRFDTLDDDTLAELEETDSQDGTLDTNKGEGGGVTTQQGVEPHAIHSPSSSTLATSLLKLPNDFTISYNCEKRECPLEEELLDFSEEEEEEAVLHGNNSHRRTNKENSSPNKKKSSTTSSSPTPKKGKTSNYFEEHTDNDDDDDIALNFFDNDTNDNNLQSSKQSVPSLAPDSPTSLDTPRESSSMSSIASPPMLVSIKSASTSMMNVDDPPTSATATVNHRQEQSSNNPYYAPQQQQRKQNYQLNGLGMTKNDRQENMTVPSSTNSTSTTGVISLPDLGLSPLAHQNELQQLGISHNHYKPTSLRTTITTTTMSSNPEDPIVHKLNTLNRPVHNRRTTAVHTIFSSPVKKLWKQSKFTFFNHVQTEMAPILANSDDNVIVSAPTGAGKTALFEMAMARLFTTLNQQSSRQQQQQYQQHGIGGGGGGIIVSKARKIVYIAPNKALCEERQTDWSKRLVDIDPGIVCTTITGDVNASSCYTEISLANLILTTPEKWDSITRRWNEHFVLLSCIKLVLIDEVHLIGETDRGGCLESIICRMKTIQRAACARMLTASEIASSSYKYTTPEALTSNMRIVAVSATLPNLGHLASFIESGEAYMFDQSYRPVPLNVYVQGCGHIGNNRYLFDKSLKQHVPSILKRFSSNRPSIVFCHSKKETEELADELTREYGNRLTSNETELMNYCNKTDNAALHRCIRKGIAFHHAGLDASDRKLVEDAFGSGSISCLVATSTLAMGVNLPSHLVVIKGTSAYRGAAEGTQDVDTGTLLQMIGRAGRPGFDTSGTAVIMTDTLSKTRYENLSQGLKVVESHLMDGNKLTEVLNIEISQGVIVSVDEAADWVKGTFLYRRILSNPLFYGCNGKGDNAVQSFILDKCSASIDNLLKIRAISMNDDGTFSPDAGCHVMSRNFIEFDAMKAIVKLPHDAGPLQLLHMMSNCAKIQTPVKRNEKKALNEAYKTIKYKLEGPQSKIRIQTAAEKCFVMLQAAIGQYFFSDFALRQQLSHVIDMASQILSAVEQYAKEGSRNGQVAIQGMLFRRSLHSSLWGENDGVLNQINGVTQEMTAKLRANGICTFADAMNSSSEDVMRAINVTETFANSLRAAASMILLRTLKIAACLTENGGELNVKLQRRVAGSGGDTHEKAVSYSLVIYTDRSGSLLHFSEDITNPATLCLTLPDKDMYGRIYIRLVSNLIGLDELVTIDGAGDVQKSSFTLSPTVAHSAKGRKNQSQLSFASASSRKRSLETHRNSVSNISDLRLHKRGKDDEEDDDCVIIDPAAVEYTASESSGAADENPQSKKVVTPSPHPHTKSTNNDSTSFSRGDSTTTRPPPKPSSQHKAASNPSWSNNPRTIRKGPRNSNRSSWFQEKTQQKTTQQTAFNSPNDNPFTSYSYDPNNIESSLASNANEVQQQSIIPNNVTNSTYSTRLQAFQTPTNAKRRTTSSTKMSSSGLLQQKAAELQRLHSNRMSMQQQMTDTSSVHNRTFFPVSDRRMNQYDRSIDESNHFTGPDTMMQMSFHHQNLGGSTAGSVVPHPGAGMSQGSRTPPPAPFMGHNFASSVAPPQRPYFQPHWGAPTGNVMQQRFSMPQSSHALNPFMARGNMQNNNNFAQRRDGLTRPVSSSGQSIASRLRGNSIGGAAHYQSSMPPQNQNHFPTQDIYDFQPQYNDDHIPGFHYGMNENHFDDTFNDSLCLGLDPTAYGNDVSYCDFPPGNFAGGMSVNDHSFVGHDIHAGLVRDQMFGNMTQFGGSNANLHVPYQPEMQQHQYQQQEQQQQHRAVPVNPYKSNMQRPQNFGDSDHPPLQEVVVQNTSVRSGLGGDDASQFDDAFL